jgi:hypothetical protein
LQLTQDVLEASKGLQVAEHFTDRRFDTFDRFGTFLLHLRKKKFTVSRTPALGTLVTTVTRIV